MESKPYFGAGIYHQPSAPEPQKTEEEPAQTQEQEEEVPTENFQTESEPMEETAREDGDYQGFFVQQERDREKAMLLKRSREGEKAPPAKVFATPQSPRKSRAPFQQTPQVQQERRPRNHDRYEDRSVAVETKETNHEKKIAPLKTEPASSGPFLLNQRVAILVDVQNMYHSAKKTYGRNLSYSKLISQAVHGRKLIRAIAYLLDREGVDQGAFIEHLSNCGFEVRRKNLIERADGSRKGDWDLGIAADAIALSKKIDVIILVSGDGDFISLTQMLKHQGVKVEVASFRESAADALVASADTFHALGKETLYGSD